MRFQKKKGKHYGRSQAILLNPCNNSEVYLESSTATLKGTEYLRQKPQR